MIYLVKFSFGTNESVIFNVCDIKIPLYFRVLNGDIMTGRIL